MLSSVIISLLCVFCVCVCEFVVGGFSMGGEFLSLCVCVCGVFCHIPLCVLWVGCFIFCFAGVGLWRQGGWGTGVRDDLEVGG